ncbi:HIT family protein [Pseudalkalibacillus hwajinpoensis]|uniref:HIT family protein n=1 Tax=Guptibacillus hwajinpoensis TaxID=208199 RepID=UPI001CFDD3A9|nr:HIT family protein [Pseudalkalibacillus hwajinpoensis]
MEKECFVCRKHADLLELAGGTIYEDEYVYVGHIYRGGKPTYPGHVMIDLKRHVPSLADMTEEEASAFGIITARVSKALRESEHAEHIYAQVSGDSVPHLHMHLIPRYPGTPEDYWGPMAVYDWPEAPFATEKEIALLCERVRDQLEGVRRK